MQEGNAKAIEPSGARSTATFAYLVQALHVAVERLELNEHV